MPFAIKVALLSAASASANTETPLRTTVPLAPHVLQVHGSAHGCALSGTIAVI